MARDGGRTRWILAFLGALGLCLGGRAAEAGTFPAFGPETFTRGTGKPVNVVRTFAIPNPSATTWTLRLEGDDGGGFGPGNTAVVKLNGAIVVKPADFNRNDPSLARPVTLAANNVLSVELRGTPGTGFSLKIEGLDGQVPVITATAAPPPNGAGWNRANVTVSFTCSDALSGIQTCPAPVTVSTEGAGQSVSGTAVDRAGNSASASVTVNLDKTAPVLAITSPTDGGTVTDPQVQVRGTIAESLSGISAISCNGSPATVSGSGFTCGLTLTTGPNNITVAASDVAGNPVAASVTATLAELPSGEPLEVRIDHPRDGLITRDQRATVSGTLSRPGATVQINGTAATVQGTAFSAEINLVEGTNRLAATAEGQGATATAAITVRRDTHPPLIVIETPRNGDRLIDGLVTVSGTVNDIIPGATVNADDVALTINGYPATVNNRTFSLPDVPLAPGLNTLQAEAVDRAGNVRRTSIQVSREPDLAGIRVRIVSGNNQQAPILHDLPQPLVVRLEAPDGTPLPDRPVEFTVGKGDGLLGDPARKLRKFTLLTDADGMAMVHFRVGSRTGVGFHRVRATTPGSLTFVDFCATALPGEATRIAIARMPPVRGVTGQPVPDVLSVIVSDDRGNAIHNMPVTFSVDFGGGGFGPEGTGETLQVLTNQDGIADAVFTLGPGPGRANNQVSADFPGNAGLPVVFRLSGVAVGPAAATTISGAVQNIAGQPIVNALIEVEGTDLTARTGPDGTFIIHNVPPGGQRVKIHGSAASDPDANVFYPDIDFAMEAISGADNPLNQIVTLPFLDMAGAKMVGGDEDVVLEMAGVPGFAIKVFAHSTIHHDGTRGPVMMSSSQVKFDKMPMPPPQGATPFVVGTLQPGGIHFDPPAQVVYPNIGGLAPGDVADVFAFHHDIGQYVNVGPGTVSEDGTVIATDPGFGFVQSGWHGVIRIPGPTAQAANGCSGRVEYQIVNAAGTAGAMKTGQVVLFTADDAKKANARAIFGPTGGTFEGAWTGGAPLVTRSNEMASGNTAALTLTAGSMTGTATLTSPTYKFRDSAGSEATCTIELAATAAKIEIEINKTPAQNDDLVRFMSTVPAKRFKNTSRIRVTGNPPQDVVVVLTNPDSRLRFPEAADKMKMLTLPKNGDWVEFEISGEAKSAAKDDAVIEAHCDSATGPICGKEEATVFYFDAAKIQITPGMNPTYTVLQDPATTDPHAKIYWISVDETVYFASEATLKPDHLDCTVDQLRNLRIGIVQNGKTLRYVEFSNPVVTGNPSLPPGTAVQVPETIRFELRAPNYLNDSAPGVAPVYGFASRTGNLQIPFGCPGGATATSTDTPSQHFFDFYFEDAKMGTTVVGRVDYMFSKVVLADDFLTWSVTYDTVSKEVYPIWQASWQLHIDSSATTAQQPTISSTSAAPSIEPNVSTTTLFNNALAGSSAVRVPGRLISVPSR